MLGIDTASNFSAEVAMSRLAVVAGTGIEGRALIIRKHAHKGLPVFLEREYNNSQDENSIAVYLPVPRLGGMLGKSNEQIGYIKDNLATWLSRKMDSGKTVTATVSSYYAPPLEESPQVTLRLEYEGIEVLYPGHHH